MRIICPACGVSSTISPDNTGVMNCVGCGKRIRYAEPTLERGEDDIDFDCDAGPPSSTTPVVSALGGRRKKPKQREWRSPLIAGLVGAVATGMVVMMVVIFRQASAPVDPQSQADHSLAWDRDHRADLLAMKLNADSLARDGKWQESYDALQKILTFVGDHEVKDPVAVTVVEAVRAGQDRAMAAMLTMPNRTIATPISPPIIEPAPTTAPAQPALSPPLIASTRPSANTAELPAIAANDPTSIVSPATNPVAAATARPDPSLAANLDPAQVAADTAPPLPGPPPPPLKLHAYTLADQVSDEQIGQAINKGVYFLGGQFHGGHVMEGPGPGAVQAKLPVAKQREKTQVPSNLEGGSSLGDAPAQPGPIPSRTEFVAPNASAMSADGGIDALCVYAILNAGRAMDVPGLGERDTATKFILEQLKQYNLGFTYHRSLRAAALSVFNRTEDNAALEEDVRWLQAASLHGAYTYGMPLEGAGNGHGIWWDNSNSQYGLLGVWSGAQVGQYVAASYWTDVNDHWTSCANPNGTWGYRDGGSGASLTMTCAGIVSLLVAHDYLDAANPKAVDSLSAGGLDQPSLSPLIDAGLAWLDAGDNCVSQLYNTSGAPGYGLYGLERVGLASGFKYFGKHDWYSELASKLVAEQHLNGSWGAGAGATVSEQTLIDTSYALLFLARGRHPILFNKLRYEGAWNNRPHDAQNLARYAAHSLERPLNWQVVNLRRNWFDWMDCPVLYITGDKSLVLTDQDYRSLQAFAEGGGLIFTHADHGSPAFNKWVGELVRKIFPKYELTQVPRDHPLYSVVYQFKDPAPLLSVSNGSRLLMVHSPTDLAAGWQLNWTDDKKPAFQMGVNLFVYAAGKANLKNRLASSYIPADPDRPDGTHQVAILQYPGEWNPEPYAWARFSRFFQWETHQALKSVAIPMKTLAPGSVPMAVLTGTVRNDFTDAECSAVQAYVQAGGVLIIDACGGQTDFIKSVQTTLLPKAFPNATPTPIAINHPLLLPSRAHADDLTHPMLRGFANEHGGKDLPMQTIAYGKGWVIFSRLDITTGLLGTQSWGINGFDPAYCQALMKNAVLWAEARSQPPSTQPTQ